MTMPEEIKDLSAVADKPLKDKIENNSPCFDVEVYESLCSCANYIYVMDLPTIIEVYKEIGLFALKYAIGIGLFLVSWHMLSVVLDRVFMMFGY